MTKADGLKLYGRDLFPAVFTLCMKMICTSESFFLFGRILYSAVKLYRLSDDFFGRDAQVFVIVFSVAVSYLSQNAARISDGDNARRNIFRHDASRTDDRTVSDRHAGKNNASRADPAVFPICIGMLN